MWRLRHSESTAPASAWVVEPVSRGDRKAYLVGRDQAGCRYSAACGQHPDEHERKSDRANTRHPHKQTFKTIHVEMTAACVVSSRAGDLRASDQLPYACRSVANRARPFAGGLGKREDDGRPFDASASA